MPPRAKKPKTPQGIEIAYEGECIVCMENFKEDVGVLKCNHSFCFACIESWSKTENTCPLCKMRFTNIDRYQLEDSVSTKSSASSSSSSTEPVNPPQPKRKKTKVRCTKKDQADNRGNMMPGFLMPNFLPAAPLFGIDPILSMYLGNPMFFPNSDEDSDFAPSEADHHWLDEEQEDFDEEDMEEDDDIFGGEHLPWHCPCPMHHLQRLTRAANERRQNPTFIDLVGDDEIEEIYPINSRNASQSNHNNEIIDLTLGDDDHDVSIVPPAEINNRQVEGEALTTVESRKRRRRDV